MRDKLSYGIRSLSLRPQIIRVAQWRKHSVLETKQRHDTAVYRKCYGGRRRIEHNSRLRSLCTAHDKQNVNGTGSVTMKPRQAKTEPSAWRFGFGYQIPL